MNDMTPQWYLSRDGSRRGPLPWNEVKSLHDSGQIAPDDLLWRQGFEDWKAADEVFPPMPPPLPRSKTRRAPSADMAAPAAVRSGLASDEQATSAAASETAPRASADISATAHVVEPKSDFELVDGGQRLIYKVKTQSKARQIIAFIMIIPLSIIIALTGFFGLLFSIDPSFVRPYGLWKTCAACIGILIVLRIWSSRPIVKPIIFDAKSINVNGRTYLLDNVSSIGWRASSGFSAGGTGWQGVAMMGAASLGHALSGQVYIQYGADGIPIITGLHPHHVEQVYSRIVGFLDRFGHRYGNR